MKKDFDVITLGYIFIEYIEYPFKKIGPFLGGTVSYSSISLAKFGNKVGIVSNIGQNTPPELLKIFYDAKVDTIGLNMKENIFTTEDILIYDKKGNKEIKYIKKAPVILFNDIPKSYFDTKFIYLCPVDYEIPIETIEKIKTKGNFKVAADLGGIGGAHCSYESRKKYDKDLLIILKKYMEFIDIAKASIEDSIYFFGDQINSYYKIIEKFLELGAKIMILTLGKDGAIISNGKKIIKIPPIENNVVDTTGAGDTFTSGFISEYIDSGDIEKSGYFASVASSLLIEKPGGVNLERIPSRSDVLKRLDKIIYV